MASSQKLSMVYKEEAYLQLSGLQHFQFCRRQWALIHVENQWKENVRTVEGQAMHKRAHDAALHEWRGDVLTVRNIRIASETLGISGACDVVEFHKDPEGISVNGLPEKYRIYPVEYKKGRPKEGLEDCLQLCAQAMCLEEMLCCDIPEGALYYGETHRRQTVAFEQELRMKVRALLEEMHQYMKRGHTPKVKPSKACNACSLKDICLPKLMRKKSAAAYVREELGGSL